MIIHIESSHGRIQEISESEVETNPQSLPADATDEQFATGDPNLRQKRLRNSTRNQTKNYEQLHRRGFTKVTRAVSLMNEFDESNTRIAGSTWGGNYSSMRQLYQAVVIPQITYYCSAWYYSEGTPEHKNPRSRHCKGFKPGQPG